MLFYKCGIWYVLCYYDKPNAILLFVDIIFIAEYMLDWEFCNESYLSSRFVSWLKYDDSCDRIAGLFSASSNISSNSAPMSSRISVTSASLDTDTPTELASALASERISLSEEFPCCWLFWFCELFSASACAIFAFASDSVIPSVAVIPRASSFAA